MCNRVAIESPPTEWARLVGLNPWDVAGWPGPLGSVRPGDWLPVFQPYNETDVGKQGFRGSIWGAYFRISGEWKQMYNARVESLTTSNLWKHAFARRRGLVLVDGFYESKGKQLYLIKPRNGMVALAALYGSAPIEPRGEAQSTVTIITRPAVDRLRTIHHRMPLALTTEAYDRWLDPQVQPPTEDILKLTYVDWESSVVQRAI